MTETVGSSKFSDITKLSGMADTPEGWDTVQRDLHKLKKWVHKNLTRFNKAKSNMHLGQGSPWYQYRMDGRLRDWAALPRRAIHSMYLLAGKIYTTVDARQLMGERKFSAPKAFQVSESYETP
ncbi:hypothetical protein HGM15179_002313 [Zosterops borbonicus]|uniref:Rna-directed dna polymerase from mobile element jockey-like n=1 Tax=Zosterops borbonicus TaxID=364589 RepID=A0A8K1GW29_9PASS|nr:hypothetical protein HGM15179_002313 [Zosterops borbonicus]